LYIVNQVTDATGKVSRKKKGKSKKTEKMALSNKAKLEETPCDGDDDSEEEADVEEGFAAGKGGSSSQLFSDSLLNEVCAEDSDDDQPLA
jgi:hypothetical protein